MLRQVSYRGAASFFDSISAQALASKQLKQARDAENSNSEKRQDIGQKVSSTIGSVFEGIKKNKPTPPPIPTTGFFVAIDGKQKGPFDISKLKAMAAKGDFDGDMLVWKDGMENWVKASDVEELGSVFGNSVPPIPM